MFRYSGTLTCTQEYDGYTYEEDTELMLTVEAGPDLNQVIITDGYDPITATFNSMNEYTATDGETTITGTLSESTLTVAFMIDYGDYSTECSGELTK